MQNQMERKAETYHGNWRFAGLNESPEALPGLLFQNLLYAV